MKKSEFKKMMKEKNKAFKDYTLYESILILLIILITGPIVYLIIRNVLPIWVMAIDVVLVLIVSIPCIVIDLQNDINIKKIYKDYLKDNSKLPKYNDQTLALKIMIGVSIVALIIALIVNIPNII